MSIQRLLDIRLEELKQDVEKVGHAVDVAVKRHQLATTIKDYLHIWGAHSVVGPLNRARTRLDRLPDILEQADSRLPQLVKDNGVDLEKIINDLRYVAGGLRATQSALDKAESRVELDESMQKALRASLEETAEIIADIDEFQRRLAVEADMATLWREVDELVATRCDPLFVDYVDFLGGLTLRDNQFDEQIGEITDVFVQQLGSHRLAVPARGPAQKSAMEVLMKLGFPEWTLWDVPMAAYEVGMREAVTSRAATRLLERELPGRSPEQKAVLYADIWAAFTGGPAYACANVLLRLRPHQPASAERPADVDRAHVIFELLKRVQAEGEFAVDVTIVRDCWTGAVDELGSDPVADAEALNRFVEQVHGRLKVTAACFGPAEWEAAIGRLRPSFAPEGQDMAPKGPPDPVVNLLNAAWSAWLRRLAAPRDIEKRALKASWRPASGGGNPVGNPMAGGNSGNR